MLKLKLLALSVLLLALPAVVQAQFNFTINNDGSLNISKYTGSGGAVIIPDTTNGLPITSIGIGAFQYSHTVTSVTLGTNVTSIGGWAFESCAKLVSVTIPDSVTNVGSYAFRYCPSLTAITVDATNPAYSSSDGILFNKSTNTLIQYPASKTGSDYTIPNSVASIGDYAFWECTNLTSVTLGTNVTSIGDSMFAACYNLTSVTIPSSVTSIGDSMFAACYNLTNVTIPNSVTSIGSYAFEYCTNLTSVTIPNNVTSIGTNAFNFCTSVTNVIIGTNVTSIGDYAFWYCTNLTSVTTGNSVTSIGFGAFYSCTRLASIAIPNNVTNIGGYAFNACWSLTSVTIPNSVTSIGYMAFSGSSLTSVTIPASVTSIGDYAFDYCTSLTAMSVDTNNPTYSSVDGVLFDKNQATLIQYPASKTGSDYTIPDSVASIEYWAFSYCSNLTSVTLGTNVTSIGEGAFLYCTKLVSVMISDSVTDIGIEAFVDCTSLTSITIPDSVTSIGNWAFLDCSGLTSVYFQGNAPSLGGTNVFYDDNNATVYYVLGTTDWSSPFGGRPAVAVNVSKPTLAITSPVNGRRWSNGLYTVTGTASNNVPVSSVWLQVNSNGRQLATTSNYWTNWTATASLIPGTNVLQAYAVNAFNYSSTYASANLIFVVTNRLQIHINGLGTVSPNYSNAWLEIGRNYSITSTPAAGFVFTNWVISTNWIGGTTTSKTNLTFMMASNLTLQVNFVDTNRPTVSITNLVAGQRVSNAVFTVKGRASDNWQVSNVVCQINGGAWSNAATVNLWTNWTAAVNLIPGTNTVAAYAVDTTGNVSTTNSVSFQFVVTNQLQIRAIGLGTILPNYSNAWLEIGRNYSITSTPASGFVFTNWVISTNWIGGTAMTKTNLLFMMASNLTLQASFVDVTKPTLTITAPTAGQHMTNALSTVVGTASDNWKVSAVWYQLTNKNLTSGTWNLATSTNNYTNWTTTVTLAVGTNTVKAYAVDLGGNYSTTSSVSVLSSNTFKLQLNFAMNHPLTSTGLNFTLLISSNLYGHIQVSTNLTSWATLTNFVGTNTTLNFRDPAATNSSGRFYRAVVP